MNDYIELSITRNGETLSVREPIPAMLRCSSGIMSCTSAICPAVDRLTQRMGELIAMGQRHEFIQYSSCAPYESVFMNVDDLRGR